jgi:hypothetical protein
MARYRDNAPTLLACALSAAAGAALMYFLDPAWGRSRRAWLQQKGASLTRATRERQDALARNTLNQVRGALYTMRGAVEADEPVDDAVLVERVRAALGHTIANPHGIEVKAFEGRVVLKGPVTAEELAEIVACTERVRGVRAVDNRLSLNTGHGSGV